jgi:hypothetical protein
MNILSRILKEIALEFPIPAIIDKNLYRRLFLSKKTNEKVITEKNEDGTNNRISNKSAGG